MLKNIWEMFVKVGFLENEYLPIGQLRLKLFSSRSIPKLGMTNEVD